MTEARPSEQMRRLGVVQRGAPILDEVARLFDLPDEREAAEQAAETRALIAELRAKQTAQPEDQR